jgi:hypothetical protein
MKNLIFILLMLVSFPSYALVRGNDIYPICEHIQDKPSPNDLKGKTIIEASMSRGFNIGFCMGIIGTSFQAIRGIGYVWSVDSKFAKCMEDYYGFEDIDGKQILDMTMKYLKNHPEYRNLEMNVIMAVMLHDYYPESVCIKNKNKK